MRTIILSRMPTLERWIARFDGWWANLSLRERWMVGGVAALLAAVVLVYGVVRPLQAARADALSDIRKYETLNARVLAAGALTPNAPASSGAPEGALRLAALRAQLGVVVTAANGGVTATIADASYDALIAWLGDVQRTSRVAVRKAQITRLDTPGHVSATIEFGS